MDLIEKGCGVYGKRTRRSAPGEGRDRVSIDESVDSFRRAVVVAERRDGNRPVAEIIRAVLLGVHEGRVVVCGVVHQGVASGDRGDLGGSVGHPIEDQLVRLTGRKLARGHRQGRAARRGGVDRSSRVDRRGRGYIRGL